MILTQEQKSAIAVGNIQSNIVGIDAQNVNFITNLLTDKLYSNPIQSFLREIVSNAYDSHIEAGSKEPVLIKVGFAANAKDKDLNKYEISIRDYGTGLSPERFNLIYKNIGSSTKRESNDYIGSLGLGRFSALAASSQCTIISYYNGVKDIYMMYKDEGTIHIDKLSSTSTTEHNGLEVSCIIERNYHTTKALEEGLNNLIFFSDIYIENSAGLGIISGFNKRKIKKFKSFAYYITPDKDTVECPEFHPYRDYSVLYGDVLYPIKFPTIVPKCLSAKGLHMRFDIGELDITPSRESLQMTKRTIAAIEKKVKEFDDELSKLVSDNFGEFKDVSQIMDVLIRPNDAIFEGYTFKFDTFDNKQIYLVVDTSTAFVNFIKNKSLIIQGKKISDKTLNYFLDQLTGSRQYACEAKYRYPNDNRYKNITWIHKNTLFKCLRTGFYIVQDKTFSPLLRYYVTSNNSTHCLVINKEHEKKLLDSIEGAFQIYKDIDKQELSILLANLKAWYDNKKIIISKDTLPKDVIELWKAMHPKEEKTKEKVERNKDEIVFYGIRPYYESRVKLEQNVLKFKGTVVVCEKNSEESALVKSLFNSFYNYHNADETIILRKEKVLFCEVAKKNIEACKSIGLTYISDYLNTETNSIFRKLAAVQIWLKLNKVKVDDLCDALLHYSTGILLRDSDREKYLQSIATSYIRPLTHTNEDLSEIIDSCVENNFVDWKFYCKLPTKEELNLLSIQRQYGLMNRAGESGFLMEMMRTKKIPIDFERFKYLKGIFNECTKNRW